MNRMKKITMIMLACLLAVGFTACSLVRIDQAVENQEPIAKVNDAPITRGEFINVFNQTMSSSSMQGGSADASLMSSMYGFYVEMTVEQMIINEVARQKAITSSLYCAME